MTPQPGVEHGPGFVRLTLVGDIDAETLRDYEPFVAEILSDPPPTVVIDLSHVPFLDSAGIGLLARLARLTQEQSATVLVADASPLVAETLRTCGLATFVTFMRSGVRRGEVLSQLRENASE